MGTGLRSTCIAVALAAVSFVSAGETSAAVFNGNAASGFGGPVGNGTLTVTTDATNVNFTFNAGASNNDYLVIYLDTVAGGFTTTTGVNDFGDSNRGAISAGDQVVFAPTFGADYAISTPGATTGSNFAGLWGLATGANNSLPFQSSANIGGTQAATTFSVSLASLGLVAGQQFNLVGTYAAGGGYLSNETFGTSVTVPDTGAAPNAGNAGTVTFADFLTVNAAAVPEPASVSVIGLGLLCAAMRRRRLA